MNDLEIYFNNNNDKLIHKWTNYFDIYDQYFSKFRNKEIVLLEIGVGEGGSSRMWKHYFGSKAKIYGVDINPECKKLEEENIEIFIGSQSDPQFLRNLISKLPPIDILIDDGGHTMSQQIVSFQELFHHVKDGGIYLCEDTHNSYWLEFGGGYKRRGTFIEYTKSMIDQLHSFWSEQKSLKVDSLSKSIRAIHYYSGIVVFEKEKIEKPIDKMSGNDPIFNTRLVGSPKPPQSTTNKIKFFILYTINSTLRFFRLPSFRWK